MESIKNNIIFFKEFLQEFELTGSFCPTSKWAANAMTAPLRETSGPKRILEVGPGTGSVTTRILEQMGDEDELQICEINPRFMAALKVTLAANPDFIRHKDRVTFFEGPVQNLPEGRPFDAIICAIPFLNLDVTIVKDIFEKFRRVANPGCELTYYEYIGMRRIGKVVSEERRERCRHLESFFQEVKSNQTQRTRVWFNVLPINVYRINDIAA